MKKAILIILLFTLLFPVTVYGETILILKPNPNRGEDTAFDQNEPDTNYGAYQNMGLGAYVNKKVRGVLKFDLNAIPEGVDIKTARLHLYYYDYEGLTEYFPFDLSLYRITQKWVVTNATWIKRTETEDWLTEGGDIGDVPRIYR